MEVHRFDALAKVAGRGASRRRVLRTLALGAGLGVVPHLAPERRAAARRSLTVPHCAFVLCGRGEQCCEGTVGPNPICYDPDQRLCCTCAGGVTYTPGPAWKTCRDWCSHLS
jgi:hypothetical protein